MTERFSTASLADLVDVLNASLRLPSALRNGEREYMLCADRREAWGIRYIDACLRRYAGRTLGGTIALEAGCGSGGALAHLARRFDHVIGIDADLPTLMIAAKRCEELGVRERVTLIAAGLEQDVIRRRCCDFVKCTDVLEHVTDPVAVCRNLARSVSPDGHVFVLTPNRWSVCTPEPHVRLWGVPFLPSSWANAYVRRRVGIPYEEIARLMGPWRLRGLLEGAGLGTVAIPIEDKHLNPDTRRGRLIKAVFRAPPLLWMSRAVRAVQPTLEVLGFPRR